MKTYSVRTLAEIITELRALREGSQVTGFQSSVIHSDRGYYDRAALTPGYLTFPARRFADELEAQIGGTMHGWKGGDFKIDADKPVAFAEDGDTGPYIAGFAFVVSDGVPTYEPIAVDTGWW